jgi:hypothetical protein
VHAAQPIKRESSKVADNSKMTDFNCQIYRGSQKKVTQPAWGDGCAILSSTAYRSAHDRATFECEGGQLKLEKHSQWWR